MNFNEFQRISTNRDKGFTQHHFPLKKSGAGFTFIETLIAVTILSLALVGTLTIVSRSVQSSIFSRDQIIAFYLAQEAIELLQNKRSTNVLEFGADDWLTGLDKCMPAQGGRCVIWAASNGAVEVRKDNSIDCGGVACQPLRFDGYLYNHDPSKPNNDKTMYKRSISIIPIDYDVPPDGEYDEIAVSVEMRWNSGTVERTFTIRHIMLNWQE